MGLQPAPLSAAPVITVEEPGEEDDENWGFTADIQVKAKVTVTPKLFIGLFLEAGEYVSAEAGANVTVNLMAEAEFNFKGGLGNDADHAIDAMPKEDDCDYKAEDPEDDNWGATCCPTGGGPPFCYDADTCAAKHHVQIDLSAMIEIIASVKILVTTDFGTSDDEWTAVDFERYIDSDNDLQEDEEKWMDWNLHLASACFGKLDDDQSTTKRVL